MSSSVRDAKRVVLCDDHEIVREAIKARMANSSVVEIVGEAGNGRDVVDVVKELEPDVLIIDVELPKRDGIEATKEVLKVRPRTKVIIFTAHAQPDLLALALRAGASGYVLKSAPSEDIARAIEVVAAGGTFDGPFYRPTVITGVKPGMRALRAERARISASGPVASASSSRTSTRSVAPPCSGPDIADSPAAMHAYKSLPADATTRAANVDGLSS